MTQTPTSTTPAPTTPRAEPASAEDRQLVITRRLAAPRPLVWAVWTDPRHLHRWWGPRGFTTTTHHADLRVGGEWRFTMHGPDGTDYPNRIVFDRLDELESLCYRHLDDEDQEIFRTTVSFIEEAGMTRITLQMEAPSAAARDELRGFGAVEGGISTLERLGEHVAALALESGENPASRRNALTVALPSEREIVLSRSFDAPRGLVFDAWTRAEHMAQWYGCGTMELAVCDVDLRVGGTFRWVLREADGREYAFHGTYREVAPPERLVYTETFEAFPDSAAVNTVVFEEADGRTTMTNTIVHPSKEARDGHLASGMEQGTAESLDRLEDHVAGLAAG